MATSSNVHIPSSKPRSQCDVITSSYLAARATIGIVARSLAMVAPEAVGSSVSNTRVAASALRRSSMLLLVAASVVDSLLVPAPATQVEGFDVAGFYFHRFAQWLATTSVAVLLKLLSPSVAMFCITFLASASF